MNMIKKLKEDIKNIQNENSKIFDKIRLLEEELKEIGSEEYICEEDKESPVNGDRETSQTECNI